MQRVMLWLWKWFAPGLISCALIAYLIWRISWAELEHALGLLDFDRLVPLTAAFVLLLYVWDSLCLRFVFAQGQAELAYGRVLRVRGVSYLFSAFNYPLGQAVFAWGMARAQRSFLRSTLTRAVLVSYHDVAILVTIGLLGSFLSDHPVALAARQFCVGTLAVVLFLAVFVAFMPRSWQQAWQESKWGAWSNAWNWGRSLILFGLRLTYFSCIIGYAGIGLALCGVPLDVGVVTSTIPLVVLIDGLPSASGLGTRESALLYLLEPEDKATVLAFCLFWSLGLIIGRVLIGITAWTLPAMRPVTPQLPEPPPAAPHNSTAPIPSGPGN
jgi:hypothetical protein